MNKIYPDSPWIYEEENFFTSAENTKLIELGLKLKPSQSGIGIDTPVIDSNIRTSNQSWIHYSLDSEWLFRKIAERIKIVNENLFKFNIQTFDGLQFTVYEQSQRGMYSKHTDCGPLSCLMRKLSMIVLLSDPSEYEGGELLIYPNAVPQTVVKKQNKIIIFPSFLIHEVTPVTKGTRYSLVTWVSGPQFT